MKTNQLVMFGTDVALHESEKQKFIRACVSGGQVERAKQLFAIELMGTLHTAQGYAEHPYVQSMVEFGREIFGQEADSICEECANNLGREIERAH